MGARLVDADRAAAYLRGPFERAMASAGRDRIGAAPEGFLARHPDERVRSAAVATWRARMVNEHRSSAVFAGIVPQMIEASTGFDLQSAALRAAQDELAHAALCADVVRAFDEAQAAFGAPGALVNSAGVLLQSRVADFNRDELLRLLGVNVLGTMLCCREAARRMSRAAGGAGGAIVNLSSICGTLGTAWMAGYSAAKAAVINFSRAAAAEGAAHGIRVNVVIPAVVETPATAGMLSDPAAKASTEKLIPLGRVGQARELANAILFLASDEASYVTGAALPVDGGRSAVLVTAL